MGTEGGRGSREILQSKKHSNHVKELFMKIILKFLLARSRRYYRSMAAHSSNPTCINMYSMIHFNEYSMILVLHNGI